LDQNHLAQGKKNASRLDASLVFLDESGLLMMPLVRRTWAPRGQTPFLWQRTNSYRKVSAIAGLVVSPQKDQVRLFFRLHPNANINAESVLSFLQHLRHHVHGPIVLLWDRFLARRARIVQGYIAKKGTWRSEFPPPYAPELNPVENAWNYLKTNSMANEAIYDLTMLTKTARRHGRALQRRESLLRSFMKHTPLFLRLH
jgi:transposase